MEANLEKLLDIKITQIQLVQDRGYKIPEQDKEILKDNVEYFYNYLKSLRGNPDDADYWVKRGFITKEAKIFLGTTINGYVSKTLKPLLIKPTEHKLDWYQYWSDDGSRSMLVYYDTKGNTQVSNTTVKTFRNLIDEAELLYSKIRKTSQHNKILEAILIVDAKLSPEANNKMNDISRGQVFLESELTFNPTLCVGNQIHSLIPKNDVKDLLQRLKADKHGLETFKAIDPTIKYYGWKEGDLIKVNRTDIGANVLSPDSIIYKLVI